jgi:hypothetical protein
MNVFVVRPFGTKAGLDFEKVQAELIDPAIEALGLRGGPTDEIVRAGNIRSDMFELLLTADLVIADITIHNANVFYELGVRHALRDKRTVLIRCDGMEVPFDLRTERYFAYDLADPKKSLVAFLQVLKDTMAANKQDSPVFALMPDLKPQDHTRVLALPADFEEAVTRARRDRAVGDLALLAEEIEGLDFHVAGLRSIARALFDLNAWEPARHVWEKVRKLHPEDWDPNARLGTIYQRLGDLTRSAEAIERALLKGGATPYARAEAHSLLARNHKALWQREYRADPTKAAEEALQSPYLDKSYESYRKGFDQDVNHFYPGLNALAMVSVQVALAQRFPAIWADQHETPQKAQQLLVERERDAQKLAAAVELSLEAAAKDPERVEREGFWLPISRADLKCLTSRRPGEVKAAYRAALAGAESFYGEAARNQLEIYQELDLFSGNVKAALEVVGVRALSAAQTAPMPEAVLLFTGHRLDQRERPVNRFPNDKAAIERVRQELDTRLKTERDRLAAARTRVIGIAGAASGGDQLFHEACRALDIPTQIFLALPRPAYVTQSVQDAGGEWVDRFNHLCDSGTVKVLADTPELPSFLNANRKYEIWARSNMWMLNHALTRGGTNVVLVALWDGESSGDGPGGTADMVGRARERGAKVIHIDTKALFGSLLQ